MLTASANDTHVVCVTPGHPRGAVTLGLSAGGVAWLDAASFTYYEAPVLVDLYPPSARAYSALHGEGGGTLLRLRGFGMANWAPSDHADADASTDAAFSRRRLGHQGNGTEHLVFCRFGAGADAPRTDATRITDKVAKCRTPALPAGDVRVFLTLNGQDFVSAPGAAGELAFYPPPLLLPTALSPASGPISGGTAVTVSGSGLMPRELTSRGFSNVVCRFGDPGHPDVRNAVPATVNMTDGTAVCVSPSTRVANYSAVGIAGAVEFRLSANGGLDAASDDVDFTPGVPPLQFVFFKVRPRHERYLSPCVCSGRPRTPAATLRTRWDYSPPGPRAGRPRGARA